LRWRVAARAAGAMAVEEEAGTTGVGAAMAGTQKAGAARARAAEGCDRSRVLP
jgi:hypothetical protein